MSTRNVTIACGNEKTTFKISSGTQEFANLKRVVKQGQTFVDKLIFGQGENNVIIKDAKEYKQIIGFMSQIDKKGNNNGKIDYDDLSIIGGRQGQENGVPGGLKKPTQTGVVYTNDMFEGLPWVSQDNADGSRFYLEF